MTSLSHKCQNSSLTPAVLDKSVTSSRSAIHVSITKPEYFLIKALGDLAGESRVSDMTEHVFG